VKIWKLWLLCIFSVLLLFPIAGLAQASLQRLHSHVRSAVSSGTAILISPLPPSQQMDLALVLPLRNQAELTSLLGRLYDPSSPDYRHFLSVAQFTSEFGPMAADYQAVVDFARANGFAVTASPANRLIVPIRGTAAQIESAFHVGMNVYRHPTEDRTFYSPDREPSLDLNIQVAHISGLNNFSIPRPMIIRPQAELPMADVTGSGPGGAYLASDMRAAYYGGTTLTGVGQSVGLLEFDGYNLSDVNLTFSSAGQSYGVPVNNVLLDGATGGQSQPDAEPVLDIVEAIGMAPELNQVRVYIGAGQDDANILNSMASENIAKQLSCSWGWLPEDPSTDDVFFQEFAAQGQSFFTSSGDDGAFDAAISPYFYPQEDAYVTAVGGTHLTTNGAGGPWASESAWNSADSTTGAQSAGSGGGISPDGISIPSWQAGVASSSNAGSTTLRNVPDVAMEGDFDNYVCVGGGCSENFAGTSFAAPRWAGFMALVNQQAVEAGNAPQGGIGFLNPAIYLIGEGSSYGKNFHDITQGNNDTENQPVWFNAVTGYDLVTGWGSANGQDLIDTLAGPQAPGFWIVSSLSTVPLPLGASATTTITVADAGGFDGSVHLAVTSALPSGVTASWGTNPTSGTSVLTLTASSSATGGTTNLTITGTSGSLTATTNISVVVHAPDFVLSASPYNVGITPGNSGTATITVTPQYGFSGNVSLAVSGLPSGVTASWGTNPTSGTSVLTLAASSSAAGGTTSLTVTGTSGALKATTMIALTINAPTFTLYVPGSLSLGQGASSGTTVEVNPLNGFTGNVILSASGLPSGVTASFSPSSITGYQESALTLTASATAAVGQYTITIAGTSGALTETSTFALTIGAPSFTLSSNTLNIGQGTSGSTSVSVNPLFGFVGGVNLAVSGLPSGVTASFSPNPTVGNSLLTLVVSSSANIGTTTLTITGTSGKLTATTTLSLVVAVPTFTLSAGSMSLGQGSSATTYIYINPLNGFAGGVSLSASGLPSGVTASFSPNPTTGYSTLILTASSSATVGQYNVTITGKSGAVTAATTFALAIGAPSFTLSAGNLSLGQGTSNTSYISVTPQNGFAGSVTLSASGLPSGVTASFSPNPTTESNLLTLTASSSATVGQYNVTITGKSGALTETTTFALAIAAPSFTISAASLSLGQGISSTNYVNVNPLNGFTGSVTLSASGLPGGVTAFFSPNPTTTGYNNTLTLTASSSAAAGQYNVTITGKSGALTETTTFALTIGTPSFTLSAGSVSLGQGTFGTSYVNVNSLNGFTGSVTLSASGLPSGVTASFSPNPTTGYNNTLTLTASNSAAVGQYNVSITGTAGNQTASTTLVLTVSAPTFTLSANGLNIGQGASGTNYVNVNLLNGFTGSVTLSASGLPSGVTASFSPNPTTGYNNTLTLTASGSAAVGQYNVIVTGKSGNQTVTTTFPLGIFAPNFTLSGGSLSLGQGTSGTTYVNVTPLNGFSGSVTLSASGLPSGVTASFSPNPTTGSSTVALTASSSASLGQYNVTITGTSGNQTATTTVLLTVSVPTFTLSAGSLNIGQGTSGTSYISVYPQNGFIGNVTLSASGLPTGVTASFSPNPTTGSSTVALTASSSASLGQYNVTITGKSGNQTVTTILPLAVFVPNFTLSASSASIGQGSSGTTYVNVSALNGFTGSVTLSASGLPSGVTASFSPNPTTGYSNMLTLTANSSATLGQYNVTITGKSGNQTTSTTLALTVSAPAFALSAGSLDIGQGASGTTYINVNPLNGFTGNVTLSASGLPNGVTVSFSPNPTNGSSTVTLTASSSASLGQYNVTIAGKSGNQTATTVLTLGVYVPTFTLSNYSYGLNIGQGSSGTTYIYMSPSYGFTGSVTLSASGLPSGVTASFSPNPTTGYSNMLTLTANSSAALGQYNVTITGTSGNQTATTVVTFGIYVPTFTISSNNLNIGQGSSGTTYIYVNPLNGFAGSVTLSASGLPGGVTASFAPNPISTGGSTLTLTASSSAALGQYNVTITGKSGNQTTTSVLSLGIYVPTFTLSNYSYGLNIGQGSSGTAYINMNPSYGFAGSVTLSASGLPSGVTASFSPNPTTGTSMVTFAASSSAILGQYNVTITGTSGNQTATTPVTLGVYVPTFTVSAGSLNIGQGTSSTTYVSVNPLNGFTGNVTLSASGLPSGVTASFSPNPSTGNSMVTLIASSSASLGQYNVAITGISGSQSATTVLTLGVYVPTFTLTNYLYGLSIGQGASGTADISVNPSYGFNGNVTMSASGLPSGVTASFSPNPATVFGTTLTLTASSSAPVGQYTVTITGTYGNQTAITTFAVTIGVPTFTLTNYISGLSIGQGTSNTTYIYMSPSYGFTGSVTLSASGLPSGVTASFSPNPTTAYGNALTLTAAGYATPGQSTVTVTGTAGNQTASTTFPLTVTASTTSGLQFIPITPCRIADTRNANGAFGGPELAAAATRIFDVPQSACGIPSTAVAYSLNVTVVPIASLGYLSIWPAGEAQPVVSTLNSGDGRVKANATITPAGTNGGVSVYASDATQFVLDIDGYFVQAGTSTSDLEFFPLTPCRIADTRNATGSLGGPSLTGNTARSFPVQSTSCGIPSSAQAYSLNVTAVPHSSLGFLSLWPSGEAQPVVSTLNALTGAVTANAAIVPAGTGGDISVLVSDASDVILDVNGYFAPPAAGGLSLYTVAPCRAIDTRGSSMAFDGTLTVPIHGSACAPPATAQAYVLNATALPVTSLSYLTLSVAGGAQPDVSTLNATDGAVTSNMAIVPTTNGSVDAFSTDSTQLILDLSSYFAP
jgi:uncharacterized membrane protein